MEENITSSSFNNNSSYSCKVCLDIKPNTQFHYTLNDRLAEVCDSCKKQQTETDNPTQPKTDKEEYCLTEIPLSALIRLGKIFKEGHGKYGKHNWRNGVDNKEYQIERCNHAIKHLLIYAHELETGEYIGKLKGQESINGQTNEEATLFIGKIREDDLAKVMWFCVTQMELERLESL